MSQNQKRIAYFGQLITINLQNDPSKFICAEGIIDPTVLVCDLTQNENSQSLKEFQKKYNLQQMSNVFRILPYMSQHERQQLQKLKEDAETKSQQLNEQQVKVQNEIQNNREIFQEYMGQPLQYDQPFILQHVKSYKYLRINLQNQSSNFNNQFQLSEYPTNTSKFKVKSSYEHMKQISEFICLKEDIYLFSCHKGYSNMGITIYETNEDNHYFNYNNLYMSLDKKQKFQMNLYRKYNSKNEDIFYYGDHVWIYFPELSEFWTLNKKKQNLVLKDFNQNDDKYSMGLWIIENENTNEGSVIKYDSPVYIKSLILNQYLEVNDDQSQNPSQQRLTLTNKKTEKTIFSLHKISNNEQTKITNNSIFVIKNIFYGINVSATLDHDLTFLKQKSEEQDIFQFIKPTDYELWESIFICQSFRIVQFGSDTVKKLIKSMNKQDHSYIDTVDDNLLSLLKQCIQKLVIFCEHLHLGKSIFEQTNDENFSLNTRKSKLQKTGFIKLIARLINACFPNDQSLLYIEQINEQQQQGIKINPIVDLAKKLYDITITCYRFLQLIIQDSKTSQFKCFENIHYFFHHFAFIEEANKCLTTCFVENRKLIYEMYEKDMSKEYQSAKLLKVFEDDILRVYPSSFKNDMVNPSDNIQFLYKQIKHDNNQIYNLINFIIDRFTNQAQKNLSQQQIIKFYSFLNSICISQQGGLTFIQIQIYILINDLKYDNNFNLEQIKNVLNKEGQDKLLQIDIIKQYLQLMSNLSFGRNYVIREKLIQHFPFDQMVNQILEKENVIQENLVNLFTSLYIETKPFIQFEPNNIINIINNIQQQNQFSQQEIEMEVFKKTKSISLEFRSNIMKISEKVINYIHKSKNKNLIYSFMILIRKLISFKFFRNNVEKERDLLIQIIQNSNQYILDQFKSNLNISDSLNQNIMVEVFRSLSIFLDITHQQNIKNLNKFFVEATNKHSDNNLSNINNFITQNLQIYIPKDNIFDHFQNTQNKEPFLDSLMNILIKSDNYRINMLVLKIFFQIIYQKTNLINNFQRIQIIQSKQDYDVYKQIKKNTKKLQFEQEQCEIWLEIPEGNNILDSDKEKTIKKFNKKVNKLISVFFPLNQQYFQPLQHKSSVILFRQILLRNMNTHSVIIQFIMESFYLWKTIKERNRNNSLFIDLIQNCITFLILFMCNNNTINKQQVVQIEDIFIESIDYYEIGQIDLLSEIYINNENKLGPQQQVPNCLIQRFILKIIKQQKYHTRYLNFLSIIIKNESNRINLINIIIKKKYVFDLLFLDPQILQKEQNIFKLNFNKCDLEQQQPYLYHIEILKIFNNLFEENFKQTTIIQQEIKQYITFNKIIKFLCMPDIFTQNSKPEEHYQLTLMFALKEQVLRLFSNILQNDLQYQSIVQNSDFKFVLQYIQIENEKISNHQNLRMPKDGEAYQDNNNLNQKSVIFQQASLQQFRISPEYINILHQKAIQNLYNQFDKSQFCNFYHYYQIAYIFPFMNSIQTQNLTQDKENQLLQVYNPYLDTFMELVNNIPQTILQDYQEIQNYVYNLKYELQNFQKCREKCLQYIFDIKYYSKQSISKTKCIQQPIYTDYLQEIIFEDKNFNLVRAIILSIITSEQVKNEYFNPQDDFVIKIIKNMNDRSQFKDLIYNMMKLVQDTLSHNYNQRDQLEMEIKSSKDICGNILQILKLIITKADDLKESVFSQKIEETEQSKDTQNSSNQQLMQKIYVDTKILNMILKNICLPDIDNQLFYAHIDLCNSILDKGYLKAQDEIYNYFIEHKESVNLFQRIQNLIKNDIINLQEPQKFNTLVFLSAQKLCNPLDYEDNIIKLLKFVSLLTKGHHFKLQDYVRVQHNLDNNFNLLQIIVLYVEQLIKNLNENNYYKLVQCLDTLTEFVQGYNLNNQNFMAQSQFIDKIQIILENYDSIELNYLLEYEKQQQQLKQQQSIQKQLTSIILKEKTQENLILRCNTSVLFSNKEIKSQIKICPTIDDQYQQFQKNKQSLTQSNDIENLDEQQIFQLIQRVMGDLNPELAIKLKQNLNQYQFEFEPWMLRRLQYKILTFLNSIVEMRPDQQMWKIIHEKISFKVLVKNLFAIYSQYKIVLNGSYTSSLLKNFEEHLKKPTFQSELIIVNGFIIYAMIQNYKRFYTDDYDQNKDETLKIEWIKNIVTENKLIDDPEQKGIFFEGLNFFHERIGYVEILNEGRNYSVYFPILPYCLRNNEVIKENFWYKADRSSQKAKLQGLMNNQEDILTELKYQQILNENDYYFIFSLFSKHQTFLRYSLFLLNLIQNIIILMTNKNDHDFDLYGTVLDKADKAEHRNLSIMLVVVQSVQIFISFFLLLLFTFTRVNKAQIKFEIQEKLSKKKESTNILDIYKKILQSKVWFTIKVIKKDGYFYIRLVYFIFSILGIFNFFFIAVLLLEIFFQQKMLQEILLSIWRPRRQIFLLIVIFCLVQYLFAVIAYFNYWQDFSDKEKKTESSCQSLYSCFSMMFDSAFKIDGGFTGIYNINQERYDNYVIDSKSIFDFLYVFIVLILLMDILGGLIVDTFGQLRDEFNKREEDILNFCYICGLYKRDLNKLGKKSDFNEHIKKKHNIWNYLYYIAFIQSKQETKMTGIESYVNLNIQESSINWFPIASNQDEFHKFSDKFTNRFQNCQQDVAQKIDKLDDQINRIYTQQKQGQIIQDNKQR